MLQIMLSGRYCRAISIYLYILHELNSGALIQQSKLHALLKTQQKEVGRLLNCLTCFFRCLPGPLPPGSEDSEPARDGDESADAGAHTHTTSQAGGGLSGLCTPQGLPARSWVPQGLGAPCPMQQQATGAGGPHCQSQAFRMDAQ